MLKAAKVPPSHLHASPFLSSRMYSRLRRRLTFKAVYRLTTRLPSLLCQLPLSKSRLCRSFFSKSRLCQFFIPRLFRTSQTLISNYLFPAVRGFAFVGWQLFRSQILPRLLAAATALVQSPRSRSQQREIAIIILPIVFLSPPTSPTADSQPASGTGGSDHVSRPSNLKSRKSR